MKKTKNILIIVIVSICILLLSSNKVEAMSQKEAGEHIKNYAINFYLQHAPECRYTTDFYCRSQAYKLIKVDGYYQMDCVGFTSLVIYQATGLEPYFFKNGASGVAVPFMNEPSDNYWPEYCTPVSPRITQSEVLNYAQPGDLIQNWHHAMVYVGDGKIIHCDGERDGNYAVDYESLSEYYDHEPNGGNWWQVYRLNEDVLAPLTQGNDGGEIHETGDSGGIFSDIKNGVGGIVDSIKGFARELVGEDLDEFRKDRNPPEDKEFYYRGLATVKDVQAVENEPDSDIFDMITNFLDWIISLMVTAIRGVFVGWANIVQIGVSEFVTTLSGEESQIGIENSELDTVESIQKQMEESLTVEKIVYNKVPVFDINIFTDTPGGKSVNEDSLTGILRKITAGWYHVIRLLSIIVLLIVLIYIGVKAAISTAAQDKAQFKEMLIHWMVAFLVVFFMHYIILFGIQMNESFVKLFSSMGEQLNLYLEVRKLTYSIEIGKGIIATIIYITLVWYLIKFVIMYFKRLIITVILIILGPLVAAKYAYDKINGGRGGTSLGIWVKEYLFSVMMQTVHALIYTIFLSMVVNIVSDGNGIFIKLVLSLLFFNFMVNGEKIVKKILKLSGSEDGSDFGNISGNLGEMVGWAYVARNRNTKVVFNIAKGIIYDPLKKFTGKAKDFSVKQIGKGYVWANKGILYDEYGIKANGKKTDIDKNIEKALKQEYQMKVETVGQILDTGKNTIIGMGKTFLAIPTFVESPVIGAGMFLDGASMVLGAAGQPIKGYKKFKKKKQYTSRTKASDLMNNLTYKDLFSEIKSIGDIGKIKYILKQLAKDGFLGGLTGGAYVIYRNIRKIYGQKLDLMENYKPEQIRLLMEAKKSEQRLIILLIAMRKNQFKGYNDDESNSFEQKAAEEYEKKLLEVINDSQKTFTELEIEEKLNEYKEDTGKNILGTEDLEIISKEMQIEDSDNPQDNIIIQDEVKENIKVQVKQEIASNLLNQKDTQDVEIKFDEVSLKQMRKKLLDMIAELEKMEKIARTNEEKEEIRRRIEIATFAVYVMDMNISKRMNIKGKNEKDVEIKTKQGELLTVQEILALMKDCKMQKLDLSKLDEKGKRRVKNSLAEIINEMSLQDGNIIDEEGNIKIHGDATLKYSLLTAMQENADKKIESLQEQLDRASNYDERLEIEEQRNANGILSYLIQQEKAKMFVENNSNNNNSNKLFEYLLQQEKEKRTNGTEQKIKEKITVKESLKQIREGKGLLVDGNVLKDKEKQIVSNVIEKAIGKEFEDSQEVKSFVDRIMNNQSNANTDDTNIQNVKMSSDTYSKISSKLDLQIEKINKEIEKLDKEPKTEDVDKEKKKAISRKENMEFARFIMEKNKEAIAENTEGNSNEIPNKRKEKSVREVLEQIKEEKQVPNSMPKIKERVEVENLLSEIVGNDVVEKTVSNMKAKELTKVIKKSIDRDGSIKKTAVPHSFSEIVEEAKKLRDIKTKLQEMEDIKTDKNGNITIEESGPIIYQKDDLLSLIRKTIRPK